MKSAPRSISVLLTPFIVFAVVLCVGALSSCGGGGNTGGPPPPPPVADFEISVSPSAITVDAGKSATATLNVTPSNGFNSQVSVALTGVPTGVTVTPGTISVAPGTSTQLQFNALSTAASATATLSFKATGGGVTHSTTASFTLNGVSNSSVPTRTKYVRTDAVIEYYLWINSHWMVLDAARNVYFITDPFLGRVTYMDAGTQKILGNISVPGAYGISEKSDGSAIYVGTLVGDVYQIDPAKKQVAHRWKGGQIGPIGFPAMSAQVLADGRLALLAIPNGIPSVDGSGAFGIWNPTDNSLQVYGSDYGLGSLPIEYSGAKTVCAGMGAIAGMTVSPDGTQVFISSIDSDGTICHVDVNTGADTYSAKGGFIWGLRISPDGKKIVIPGGTSPSAIVLNADTLAEIKRFDILGDTGSDFSFLIGPDSNTLYTSTATTMYAYNITTGNLLGWLPNIYVPYTAGGGAMGPPTGPNMGLIDSTGLIAGVMEEGIGFLDTTKLQTGPVGTQFANAYLQPGFGPTAGGNQVLWQGVTDASAVSAAYMGGKPIKSVANASGGVDLTIPSGKPGAADFYAFTNDGGMQLVPDAYSYGPTILQVTPNESSPAGGGTAYVLGYGFGNSNTLPADLAVSVGGVPATITSYYRNAYGLSSPPFLLQAIAVTLPPGTAPADITVTNSAGSATLKSAISYTPAVQTYSASGAQMAQGIYDPNRDRYYFTDATKLRVFSKTLSKWLTSIPIPGASGERLWGLSLSPDGTKLAIADVGTGSIYLLNPDSPASIQTFAVPSGTSPFFTTTLPNSVAVGNNGVVYFTALTPGVTGADGVFSLDTTSGTWTNLGLRNGGLADDIYLRIALSTDGARAYTNICGFPFEIDTATATWSVAYISPGGCYGNYEQSLSANQTSYSATDYFYDADLNPESYMVWNDREWLTTSYVYGAKLSPDGILLFQPAPHGIDIFDAHSGRLYQRIALPNTLSPNYDALVSDGIDNVLIAITGSNGDGIAIVDLSSMVEPPLAKTLFDSGPLPHYHNGFRKNSTRKEMTPDPSRKGISTASPESRHSKRVVRYDFVPILYSKRSQKK